MPSLFSVTVARFSCALKKSAYAYSVGLRARPTRTYGFSWLYCSSFFVVSRTKMLTRSCRSLIRNRRTAYEFPHK